MDPRTRRAAFLSSVQQQENGQRKSKLLRDQERELVYDLEDKDLMKLTAKLIGKNIISVKISDRFKSLDHSHLPPQLQVRYLLQHVYSRVSQRGELYKLFIELLVKEMGCLRNAFLTEYSGKEVHICFAESHISSLVEFLGGYSDKWEELATMLCLTRSQIGECRNYHNNGLRLCHVISEWVTGEQVVSNPPTLSNLKTALASAVVGLPNLALKADKKLCGQEMKKEMDTVAQGEINILEIKEQSNSTTVQHCKSALLGVKVSSLRAVEYQWKLNGKDLYESDGFSGVNEAVLCVHRVGGPRLGHYNCSVSDGFQVVYSEAIALSVKYDTVTKYFFRRYEVMSEVPRDSWPPVTSTDFINLVLVTKTETITDRYAYAIQGDMDDIIKGKEKCLYESEFDQLKKRSLVFVEGRPGSGKTTLMYKIARDWALKKNILWDSKIVLLVPLRLLGVNNKEITLSDMFKLYTGDEKDAAQFLSMVEKENGKGLSIIIDGLDEYKHRNDKSTVVSKLIHKKLLPLSVTIVASRPIGTVTIRQTARASKRLEVLGFTNDQIFEYIKNYYKEDSTMALKLQLYLNMHLNLLRMCYLPVHAAMICYLFSFLEDNIPQTETEIYKYFTQLTIQRKLNRDDEDCSISMDSLDNLPEGMKTFFYRVCSLAFNMTVQSKQVVLQSETEFPLSKFNLSSDEPSLGLVIIDSTAAMFGFKDTYTFLHLTFQEFLAADHLARLENDEQLSVIRKYCNRSEFRMVLRFFFGIVDFKEKLQLINYIMTESSMDILSKFQCAFESQDSSVCDYVLSKGEIDCLSFHDLVFVPMEFLAIAYVLSASHFFVSRLTFDDCLLDGDGIKLFLEKVDAKKLKSMRIFMYPKANSPSSQYNGLHLMLIKLANLDVLNLSNLEGQMNKIGSIFSAETHLPLRFLKIGCSLMCHKESLSHFKDLKVMTSLRMYLYFPKLNNYVEQCIECAYVTSRALSLNFFLDTKSSLMFICNSSLKMTHPISFHDFSEFSEMMLINCGITDDEIELLVKHYKSWKGLKALHLDFNFISCEGAKLLAGILNEAINLKFFSIHCNGVGETGAVELAIRLNMLSHLRVFDCRHNNICQEVSKTLCILMHRFTMSPRFYFSFTENISNPVDLRLLLNASRIITEVANTEYRNNALKCSQYAHTHVSIAFLTWAGTLYNPFVFENYCDQCCHGDEVLSFKFNISKKKEAPLQNGVHVSMISVNPIGMDLCGAEAIADGLRSCCNLQVLEMYNSGVSKIYVPGIEALAGSLKYCCKLKVLDLSRNSIESDGIKFLVSGLKHCVDLKELHLEENYIGNNGAIELAGLLKYCTNLEILNLRDNFIQEHGAVALVKEFSKVASFRSLILYGNPINSSSDSLVRSYNPKVIYLI